MFIRIMNETNGPVKRTYLEKLGISTKREDDRTIGCFGSGSKLAPIAALRKGWRWISVGNDLDGDYQMEYSLEADEEGFQHVFFDYGDYKTPSSYTADAGLLSWTDSFQIFREAFTNAIDAFLADGLDYSIDYVTEIENVPGHFCTYLTADVELVNFVENIEKYFILERQPLCEVLTYGNKGYKLYEPFDNSIGLYSKGVAINHDGEDSRITIFDIDGPFQINEERRVTNKSYALDAAMKHYILPGVKDLDVLETYLSKAPFDAKYWEHHLDTYGSAPKNPLIKLAWKNLFGGDIAIPNDVSEANKQSLMLKGYKFVEVGSPFWYDVLVENDVPNITSVLKIDPNFNIAELNASEQLTFNKAIDIVRYFDEKLNTVNDILAFEPKDNQTKYNGIYDPKGQNIYLSRKILHDLDKTVGILVHELDHHITGIKDSDMFRNSADERIGKLMTAMYLA